MVALGLSQAAAGAQRKPPGNVVEGQGVYRLWPVDWRLRYLIVKDLERTLGAVVHYRDSWAAGDKNFWPLWGSFDL